jgi:hypothetical protein
VSARPAYFKTRFDVVYGNLSLRSIGGWIWASIDQQQKDCLVLLLYCAVRAKLNIPE